MQSLTSELLTDFYAKKSDTLSNLGNSVAAKLEKRQAHITALLEELYAVMQHNEELRAQKREIAERIKSLMSGIENDEQDNDGKL